MGGRFHREHNDLLPSANSVRSRGDEKKGDRCRMTGSEGGISPSHPICTVIPFQTAPSLLPQGAGSTLLSYLN
ncbi:hypothetical protein PAHAL_2G242800 [Panicum hallii]|uniref:Uncharacterized protein n=1 Tax=Panicum hallii TaxID=206008 RepID=A0A2S3GZ20_9POAL|nr:hypothetical protein PAHAL_2G242800 [Panicum hallii]PAN12106.1 hypothetical protein PAHAL_2G242800 [Panicum hallii]